MQKLNPPPLLAKQRNLKIISNPLDIKGNQIKCSSARPQINHKRFTKQPLFQEFLSPKETPKAKQAYFMRQQSQQKVSQLSQEHISQKNSVVTLSTLPTEITKPITKGFNRIDRGKPNYTTKSFFSPDSRPTIRNSEQSAPTLNFNAILEQIKTEFKTDKEDKNQVIQKYEEQIHKDFLEQKQEMKLKNEELSVLNSEYQHFYKQIALRNGDVIHLQQENTERIYKIQQLEQDIQKISKGMKQSFDKLKLIEAMKSNPNEQKLKQLYSINMDLDNLIENFKQRLREEYMNDDALILQ